MNDYDKTLDHCRWRNSASSSEERLLMTLLEISVKEFLEQSLKKMTACIANYGTGGILKKNKLQ